MQFIAEINGNNYRNAECFVGFIIIDFKEEIYKITSRDPFISKGSEKRLTTFILILTDFIDV